MFKIRKEGPQVKMVLKIAAIVNGNARGNKRGVAERERYSIHHTLPKAQTDVTSKAEMAQMLAHDYLKERPDILIVSGGDGTIQNMLTNIFRENYRAYGSKLHPVEFARQINNRAQENNAFLPAIYHRRRGTVNVYADTLKMKGNLEMIAENLDAADNNHEKLGIRAFARAYVPIMMLYPLDNPCDLSSVQLMTMYADGFLYNVFEKYYEPKDRGEDTNILTAIKLIAKAAASIGSATICDKISTILTGYDHLGKSVYKDRFVDDLIRYHVGNITIDGKTSKDNIRNALAIGTMGINTYGLKPFHLMPTRPQSFRHYYIPGASEEGNLNITNERFHLLMGDLPPTDIITSIPLFLTAQKTSMRGLHDTLANKVSITQDDDIHYIADGSRHMNGKNFAIELAYLQPFVLLDNRPE